MIVLFISFFAACLFGIGIGIGGMTLPSKVISFLDVFGSWDLSLLFVMIGAISVYSCFYFLIIKKLKKPLLAPQFQVTTQRRIDLKLMIGAALFGVGWGIGGLCPGPAIVSLVTFQAPVLIFLISMTAGVYLYNILISRLLSAGQQPPKR